MIYWGLKGKLVECCEEKHAKPQGHMEEKVKQDSLSILELIEIFNIDCFVTDLLHSLDP